LLAQIICQCTSQNSKEDKIQLSEDVIPLALPATGVSPGKDKSSENLFANSAKLSTEKQQQKSPPGKKTQSLVQVCVILLLLINQPKFT
jgi:hypothetical protein